MTAYPARMYRDPAKIAEENEIAALRRQKRKHPNPFEERPMTQNESAQMEELLQIWWRHNRAYRPALDAPPACPFTREAKSDDTYTDGDEIDSRIAAEQAEQMEAEIDLLPFMHRAALGVTVGNKVLGNTIFKNPRISREEQHQMYQEAKEQLLMPFVRRGLMQREENLAPVLSQEGR